MEIEWSNWGEVFLNPQLILMMEYAYKKNIRLTVGNGANLNTVTPEVLEALVKYKLRYITCSIDGVSQKTYQQYRVGGNIEQVRLLQNPSLCPLEAGHSEGFCKV